MKKWVERHWYDFEDPDMREQLDSMIQEMKDIQLDAIAKQITNTIEKHVNFFFPSSLNSLIKFPPSEKRF